MGYTPSGQHKSKILIVDDTPENLRLLSQMLMDKGYTVRASVNGTMALKSIEMEPPDIILLDINMPDMNGYEVCQQLKNNEHTRHIPVIFISALNEVADKVTAFSVGGVDFITKPFKLEEVLIRVHTHISLQQMHRVLQEQNDRLQQEIAERKRAEELLQVSNEKLTRLVEELEQQNREMGLMNQLADFLERSQSQEEAFSVCLPLLRQLFAHQQGVLYMLHPESSELERVLSWGDEPISPQTFTPSLCWAMKGVRIHLIEDADDAPQCEHIEGSNPFPYLCIQLTTRGETFGLLHMRHGPCHPDHFYDRWERLGIMVADRLALFVSNLRLRQQLHEQSGI